MMVTCITAEGLGINLAVVNLSNGHVGATFSREEPLPVHVQGHWLIREAGQLSVNRQRFENESCDPLE
jgi:hypothetical protein